MSFTRTQLAGAVATASVILPAAAFAATINGGPGSERLRGTTMADTIKGNGGNDRIRGLGGADALNGGNRGRAGAVGRRADHELAQPPSPPPRPAPNPPGVAGRDAR